jgi:hypothetical protein
MEVPMAEEVKKKYTPDPNSAKYKLNAIAAQAYADAAEAKARGEKIGWCASNFPVEIPATLGLHVVYPENQAAGIAAAICVRRGITPRELESDVTELQEILRKNGAILDGVH